MGCSTSQPQKAPSTSGGTSTAPENPTWAVKKERSDRGTETTAAGNLDAHRSTKSVDASKTMVVSDADDSSEIEVIFEGKPNKVSKRSPSDADRRSAANGQEANASPTAPPKRAQPTPEQVHLSQRQKEEAAKLAEQRKRFDNQRYTRGADGPGAEAATSSPNAADPATSAQRMQSPLQSPAPAHDLVMALNVSEGAGAQGGDDLVESCLPGGVGDSPRAEPPTKLVDNKSKHEYLDDDDEVFMKEILDSVEV